jgi:hypothetical protein
MTSLNGEEPQRMATDECDKMNVGYGTVCIVQFCENKQKEWHHAIKPLKIKLRS